MIDAKNSGFLYRSVAGVQPTNKLHVGNYFGAVRQTIDLQSVCPGENFCFIADYHAQTVPERKDQIPDHSFDMAVSFLALGVNPHDTNLYRQSDVPEVMEIMWLLAIRMSSGTLERGHKMRAPGIQTAAIYLYPLLMAADILGIKATLVPVGDDQQQHLERARDAARRFNAFFDTDFFPIPERAPAKTGYVPGIDALRGAEKRKMSKSFGNIIPIFCSEEETGEYVNKIATQPVKYGQPIPTKDDTVYELYKLVASLKAAQDLKSGMEGAKIDYREAKERLTDALNAYFRPARERRQTLLQREDWVWDVLREGAGRVRYTMQQTLAEMRELTGIGRRRISAIRRSAN